MRSALLGSLCALALSACDGPALDPRTALVADTLARADLAVLRARPTQSAARYARMAGGAFEFYRGAVPVFLRDWRDGAAVSRSRYALDAPLVRSTGDAHPENFGTLRRRDGRTALECNDFDGADRAPYLWDVRRLTTGLCLAARLSNADSAEARAAAAAQARSIARAAARRYALAIADAARGARPDAITAPRENPMLEDLFRRSERDAMARTELAEFTVQDASGARRLRRGSLDPTDPMSVAVELPTGVLGPLRETIVRYRTTLIDPPPERYFTLLDAVRELGSGVASYARVRVLVLVRGPTDAPDDDVVLEMKELTDPSAGAWLPPGVFEDSVEQRVRESARMAWAVADADPLWSTGRWLGMPVQLRTETGAAKTLRVSRMSGARGTPAALLALADSLGMTLARIHSAPVEGRSPAGAITARIASDVEAFADEQADAGCAYATQTEDDGRRFRDALAALGPTLGVTPDEGDRLNPTLRTLFATETP